MGSSGLALIFPPWIDIKLWDRSRPVRYWVNWFYIIFGVIGLLMSQIIARD